MTDAPTLAFLDCETTSLRHDRRAWEVALIVRKPEGKRDREYRWYVQANDLDLGNADLQSLKFGGFYDRHPDVGGTPTLAGSPFGKYLEQEKEVLTAMESMTRSAILLGSNPSFDAELLATRMRAHGICPSWHYHLEDVPTMAKGWLYGTGRPLPETWKSDQISLACGVDPARYDRHSALGDCRWIRDLHDVVTGVSARAEATAA